MELLLAECPQLPPLLLRLLFSRKLTNSSKEGLLVVLVQYPRALQMVYAAEQHPYENCNGPSFPALPADVGVLGQPQEMRQQQQEDHQPYQQQQHYNHHHQQQQQQQQDKQQQRLAWLPSPGALLLQLAAVTASAREEDLDVLDAGWFLCASVMQQLSKSLVKQTQLLDVRMSSPAGLTCHGDSTEFSEHGRSLTEDEGTSMNSGRVYDDLVEGMAATTSGGERSWGDPALVQSEVVGNVLQSLRLLATADCPESSVRYLKAVVRAGVAVAEGCLGHLRRMVEAEVGGEVAVPPAAVSVEGGGTSAPSVSKQKVAAGANIDSGRSTDLQVQRESRFKGEQLVLRLQEGLAECLEADVELQRCVAQLWELLGSTEAVLTYIKGQYEAMCT